MSCGNAEYKNSMEKRDCDMERRFQQQLACGENSDYDDLPEKSEVKRCPVFFLYMERPIWYCSMISRHAERKKA